MSIDDIKRHIKEIEIDGKKYKIEYTNRALMAYSDFAEGESVYKVINILAKKGSYIENFTFRQCIALVYAGLLEHNKGFNFDNFLKRPLAVWLPENMQMFFEALAEVFKAPEIAAELPKKKVAGS